MKSSRLLWLGGLAAILSGALFVVAELLYVVVGLNIASADLTGTPYFVQSLLFLIAAALLPAALIGLYAGQKEDAGALGLAGLVVGFLGSVLAAGSSWFSAFVLPALARTAPEIATSAPPALVDLGDILSWGLLTLGWLLFGVAALRARVYPRPAAMLLIVGAVLVFLPLPFSAIVFGVAVAWLGARLISGDASGEQSVRVN